MPPTQADYVITDATPDDIPELLSLQRKNLTINGGSLSVEFPAEWFERSLQDMPIVIARRDGVLAGYLVASSRSATQNQKLIEAKFRAYTGSADAYNSGPLCIAATERGRGLALLMMDAQRARLAGREGVAFIRRDNAASRSVHAKGGYREVAEFSHAGIEYLAVARPG
jgi:L-amino acid N-acyltransferase YncA